jgi:hypothetical protein
MTLSWLGEAEEEDLKALLKPFPADEMRINDADFLRSRLKQCQTQTS